MSKIAIVFLLIMLLLLASGCVQENPSIDLRSRSGSIPSNAVKMKPGMDGHPPMLHEEGWEEPVPLGSPINSAGAEDSPFITPDGKNFYFFFTPDVKVPPEKQLIDGATGIWWSKKENGAWQEPERVVLNNDLSLDGCVFVQGDTMWFCSVRAGNMREIDLYTAKLRDGEWTDWKNAGEKMNLEHWVGEMHITSDGSELWFHSTGRDGKEDMDIWVSRLEGSDWQAPEKVDAVNTDENDGYPFVTSDGSELWFTRTYMGTPGVFRSVKVDGQWQEAELIVSQFAGEPTLDDEGNLYFVHHFYEDGEMLEADIYVAYRKA